MTIVSDNLVKLQRAPEQVRNICILAHVDHGKTSLSDCLLASNGIISQSMQGKIRYLDSREDEQARGITMESSAISLYFRIAKRPTAEAEAEAEASGKPLRPVVSEHMINLIDSPGHIDFASEVSTASRLCDGAVILVDAVEGVCSQTVTVLRQAWLEKLKPILLINKMDRLITELRLTSSEAYVHISKLIEQINAVVGSFFAGQRMEDDMKWREYLESTEGQAAAKEYVEASDDEIYFTPEKNNVVFGSAIDGWGFNISQFAAIYERKLGMKREKLEKVLWGDFYFDPKTKKVLPGTSPALAGRNLKPLFVQLVLDSIWAVYNSALMNRDDDKISKIVSALDLQIQPRDIQSKDPKGLVHLIFNQWIPISRSVLLSVVEVIPSPKRSQADRMVGILESTPGHDSISEGYRKSMQECDSGGRVSAFISKVVSVPKRDLPSAETKNTSREQKLHELRQRSQQVAQTYNHQVGELSSALDESSISDEYPVEPRVQEEDVIIGFARLYSGTLRVNQELYLLGPRFNPDSPTRHSAKVTVSGLYILMGRDLVAIHEAPAGSIVGIGGLDGKILKSGTLVDVLDGAPNLASTSNIAPPILRVAVEPVDPTKLPELEKGLRLLNVSDPCVEVSIQENGEHILATAGELHLERCIKDLKERFAKVDIHYSTPLVPFRETIVDDKSWQQLPERQRGEITITAGGLKLKVLVFPLDPMTHRFINFHQSYIRSVVDSSRARDDDNDEDGTSSDFLKDPLGDEAADEEVAKKTLNETELEQFREELGACLTKDKNLTKRVSRPLNSLASFGPKKVGANLLFDESNSIRPVFERKASHSSHSKYENNLLAGFQLAMAQGPLCAENCCGVGCVVLSVTLDDNTSGNERRIISSMREAIHQGIGEWSPRLMLATYLCDIQATSEVLGRVYGVVTRRRGKVINEEMKEGTPFFTVTSSIPVVEAFGFSEEMRKRTSGAANPQLVFNGFEMLDQDPFWIPTSEEELEELGDTADKENIALSYLVSIRRRKGLPTHEKLVENAEQQRTMKK